MHRNRFHVSLFASLAVVLALLSFTLPTPALAAEPAKVAEPVILSIPWRTQFDDSPYAAANCGPATMGMILGGFGIDVPTHDLRQIVIQLQGSAAYDDGTYIENLARIAERYGIVGLQLTDDSGDYHRWTLEDIRYQLRAGRPVVPQVHYRSLPGHEDATYYGDHYIAIVGYVGDDFLYRDPAMRSPEYSMRRISGEQLYLAMKRSDYPFAALSFAAEGGMKGLERVKVVNAESLGKAGSDAKTVLGGAPVLGLDPAGQLASTSPAQGQPLTSELIEVTNSTGASTLAGQFQTNQAIPSALAWLLALLLPVLMGIARSRLMLRQSTSHRPAPAVGAWLTRRPSVPTEAH